MPTNSPLGDVDCASSEIEAAAVNDFESMSASLGDVATVLRLFIVTSTSLLALPIFSDTLIVYCVLKKV